MKTIISASVLLVLLSNTLSVSAATVKKKLSIKDIKKSSITVVRVMYNKKRNMALRVGRRRGYASCELYDHAKKGTCTVQFPGSQEIITKCKLEKVRGRNTTSCYSTNLLFFFPNARK
ncbi:MAG: hypothetical protein KAG34_03405 [Cocleimonas sp.]|nr:hypothetical protein [Cocleimonas sp.]